MRKDSDTRIDPKLQSEAMRLSAGAALTSRSVWEQPENGGLGG